VLSEWLDCTTDIVLAAGNGILSIFLHVNDGLTLSRVEPVGVRTMELDGPVARTRDAVSSIFEFNVALAGQDQDVFTPLRSQTMGTDGFLTRKTANDNGEISNFGSKFRDVEHGKVADVRNAKNLLVIFFFLIRLNSGLGDTVQITLSTLCDATASLLLVLL